MDVQNLNPRRKKLTNPEYCVRFTRVLHEPRVGCKSSEIEVVGMKYLSVTLQMKATELFFTVMSDETLFRVFDIAFQGIHYSWRNSKQTFTIFYDN